MLGGKECIMSARSTVCFAVVAFFASVGIAAAAFDNPAYTYHRILDVGPAVDTTESQLSWDETKILWSEREKDLGGTYIRKAVKYGDWNAVTKSISNIVTVAEISNAAGVGALGYAKWSPDDSYIAYGLAETGGENAIKRYKLSDSTVDTLYSPEAGVDWGNFDFYGNNDSVVFWDYKSSTVLEADLFVYDGTTRTQLTDTDYKEYEPRVFGSDTSQVLYWSGEKAGLEPYRGVHILNSDSSVTDVALGTADHNYFWPVWGKDQSHIGIVDHGSALWNGDLLLYEKVGSTWQFADDLTGDGYEGESIIFFGSFDSAGGFIFNFEESDGSRDIWFAKVPEPSSAVLLVCAAFGLLPLLRRPR
jgi:hypothetical protein